LSKQLNLNYAGSRLVYCRGFNSGQLVMVMARRVSTRGTLVSRPWRVRYRGSDVPERYPVSVNGWTPLSQKRCQKTISELSWIVRFLFVSGQPGAGKSLVNLRGLYSVEVNIYRTQGRRIAISVLW